MRYQTKVFLYEQQPEKQQLRHKGSVGASAKKLVFRNAVLAEKKECFVTRSVTTVYLATTNNFNTA